MYICKSVGPYVYFCLLLHPLSPSPSPSLTQFLLFSVILSLSLFLRSDMSSTYIHVSRFRFCECVMVHVCACLSPFVIFFLLYAISLLCRFMIFFMLGWMAWEQAYVSTFDAFLCLLFPSKEPAVISFQSSRTWRTLIDNNGQGKIRCKGVKNPELLFK